MVKVMLSAVVVGMIGIHFMRQAGLVKLHIKATKYLSNVMGGLIFGFGFGLSAYCLGTGAAAIGQGNFDGLLMVVGMIAGSYLFDECSGWIGRNVDPVGKHGKITLHDWIPAKRTAVVIGSAVVLTIVQILMENMLP